MQPLDVDPRFLLSQSLFEAVSNGSVFPCVRAPYKFPASDIPAALPESGLDYVSQDDTAALAAAGSMCCRRAAGSIMISWLASATASWFVHRQGNVWKC